MAAVAARDPARAEAFAAAQGVARVHDSYAALLADPDIAAGLEPRGGAAQARPSEIDHPPSTGMATPVTNEASAPRR